MPSNFALLPPQLSGLAAVGGFLLLAHAHNRKHLVQNLLRRGRKTEGRVVELRENPQGQGFAPVVEYTTESGSVLKHFSTTYRTPSPYSEGQTVPIWYENYKSRREATLEDDEAGTLPKKLAVTGFLLLLLALPRILSGLTGLL